MAASGNAIELMSGRAIAAERHLRAAVKEVMASALEADGPELGALLIVIREAGIDPLEAAFVTGVRRFDKSGEYAADGALSVTAGSNGDASYPVAQRLRGSRSANSWSDYQRLKKPLLTARSGISTLRSWLGRPRTWAQPRCAAMKVTFSKPQSRWTRASS